jgi:hypothetical protein
MQFSYIIVIIKIIMHCATKEYYRVIVHFHGQSYAPTTLPSRQETVVKIIRMGGYRELLYKHGGKRQVLRTRNIRIFVKSTGAGIICSITTNGGDL